MKIGGGGVIKELKILLVCGSGASTGFMAANMRTAAKKAGIVAEIIARSEAEIDSYVDEIDVLMVGPHLAYLMEDVEEITNGYDVKVILMKPSYYSTLNGEEAISHLLEVIDG